MAAETVKPKYKHKTRKVDVEAAVALKVENNLSYEQIAALQGVTDSAIHKAIKGLIPTEAELQQAKQFKSKEADITAIKRAHALSLVDEATLKAWKDKFPAAFVLFYNSLFNNERLERNQATTISGYDPGSLRSRMDELRQLLNDADVVDV